MFLIFTNGRRRRKKKMKGRKRQSREVEANPLCFGKRTCHLLRWFLPGTSTIKLIDPLSSLLCNKLILPCTWRICSQTNFLQVYLLSLWKVTCILGRSQQTVSGSSVSITRHRATENRHASRSSTAWHKPRLTVSPRRLGDRRKQHSKVEAEE